MTAPRHCVIGMLYGLLRQRCGAFFESFGKSALNVGAVPFVLVQRRSYLKCPLITVFLRV